jgi:imidazolonepropionase-like amidohydrolase
MGCASVLAKNGVQFAFSSGGNPSLYLDNIRKLLNFGIDKDTALKAMTLNAAEILGVKDQVGSIEVGKQANLVLMSDEFTNASSKVTHVWITGKVVLEPKKEAGK